MSISLQKDEQIGDVSFVKNDGFLECLIKPRLGRLPLTLSRNHLGSMLTYD
jgi:hypothetical protein